MNNLLSRILKLWPSHRKLTEEQAKTIAQAYLEKEKSESLPEDVTVSYSFFSDEWVLNLRHRMRPGCWVTISDETGEVTRFHNPPR